MLVIDSSIHAFKLQGFYLKQVKLRYLLHFNGALSDRDVHC